MIKLRKVNNSFIAITSGLLIALTLIISCDNKENNTLLLPNLPKKKKQINKIIKVEYYKSYKIDLQGKTRYFNLIKKDETKGIKHSIVFYDKKNRILREEERDEKRELVRYNKTIYDHGLKKIEGFDDYDNLIFIRYYNKEENLTKQKIFSSGKPKKYIYYSYNENGQLIKEKHFSFLNKKKLKFYRDFEYDKQNRLINIHFYNPKGKLISTYKTIQNKK